MTIKRKSTPTPQESQFVFLNPTPRNYAVLCSSCANEPIELWGQLCLECAIMCADYPFSRSLAYQQYGIVWAASL